MEHTANADFFGSAVGWKKEAADVAENYKKLGNRLPAALEKELCDLEARLNAAVLPDKTSPIVWDEFHEPAPV
jgi:hypothetical protein